MVAKLIFFCMSINWPSSPGFRVKIILNFKHDNKVIRTNLYSYKILLIWPPFMNKVYTWFGSSIAFNMNHDHVELAMKFLIWKYIHFGQVSKPCICSINYVLSLLINSKQN